MEMNHKAAYDWVLLLTACISPKGMIYTAEQDPRQREAAYIDTLKWYLKHTNLRIVFCNNSGEDIVGKVNDPEGRVEFLSFAGNNFDKHLGKGYGEFQILEYAFAHSHLLEGNPRVAKVTGKLKVLNIMEELRYGDACFSQSIDYVLVNTPPVKE